METTTKTFIESLLNMCDPFVRDRFSTYKQMAVEKKGLSFMQRMEKDSDTRNTIKKLMDKKIDIDELKLTL